MFSQKKTDRFLRIARSIYKFVQAALPYFLPLLSIAYLAGFIFMATQNPLPYINIGGSISIIYPRTTSQQTILETVVVFILLSFIFLSLLGLYLIGSRRYHASQPTPLLALSLFLIFILFFILWVMLLPKISP